MIQSVLGETGADGCLRAPINESEPTATLLRTIQLIKHTVVCMAQSSDAAANTHQPVIYIKIK